ncbi:hypothetical protein U6V30_12245, partial [Cutibacterium acnes]
GGNLLSTQLNGGLDQGTAIPIDYDAQYIPTVCQLYAGLQVISILATSAMGGAGTDFGYSGVGLIPREIVQPGMTAANQVRNRPLLCAGAVLRCVLNASSAGTLLTLVDVNHSTALTITLASLGGALDVNFRSTVYNLAPGVSAGQYDCTITFNQNKSISVQVGDTSVTIPAGTTPIENVYVANGARLHSVQYLG